MEEELDELVALGHLAEHVQAVADLGAGQLAEVAVDLLQEVREILAAHLGHANGRAVLRERGVPYVRMAGAVAIEQQLEVGAEVGALQYVPDLALQQRRLRRV